jgi:hypothetical protein
MKSALVSLGLKLFLQSLRQLASLNVDFLTLLSKNQRFRDNEGL